MKQGLYAIIFVILSSLVSGAVIHGNVYSFDLELRNDTIVKIDTTPEQTIVSKDGIYSFDVEPGKYIITAYYYSDGVVAESASENVEIKKEGNFILDLIMFPSFAEEDELLLEVSDTVLEESSSLRVFDIVLIVVFFAALGASVFYILRTQKKIKKMERPAVSDLADEVISYIEGQGGRVTQKDIRKQFPLSEAKISLVISELEDKKVLKRIKKGRGNIIVLQ